MTKEEILALYAEELKKFDAELALRGAEVERLARAIDDELPMAKLGARGAAVQLQVLRAKAGDKSDDEIVEMAKHVKQTKLPDELEAKKKTLAEQWEMGKKLKPEDEAKKGTRTRVHEVLQAEAKIPAKDLWKMTDLLVMEAGL